MADDPHIDLNKTHAPADKQADGFSTSPTQQPRSALKHIEISASPYEVALPRHAETAKEPFFTKAMRLFRATSVRFTLMYILLFLVSVFLLGVFVYDGTFRPAVRKLDHDILREAQELSFVYQRRDPIAVNNRILKRRQYRDNAYYFFFTVPQNPSEVVSVYTGSNLPGLPDAALSETGLFEFTFDENIEDEDGTIISRPAIGRLVDLRDEADIVTAKLFIAREISDIASLRASAQETIFRVAIVTLILSIVMGVLFSRTFLGNVHKVNRTAAAIRKGDIQQRIPINGTGDEFDNLAENLNGMLDRIEFLISGMKQVSDNIAHDLRSPLTRIRSRLDIALTEAERLSDAESLSLYEQSVDKSVQDVDRLLATFNALLSITRIESGEGGGNFKNVDLNDLVTEVVELFEPAAEDMGFTLTFDHQHVKLIKGSRELISQALANLLDNAMKYGERIDPYQDDHPKIHVTLRPEGNDILLDIQDNGDGVPVEKRDKIFHRFYRVEDSRTTTGNGLGLSMVAAIARAHQARILIGDGIKHTHSTAEKEAKYGLSIRLIFPKDMK